MKKIFLAILFVLALAFNTWAAAGSWSAITYDDVSHSNSFRTFTITFTGGTGGDAGTVPNWVLSNDSTLVAFYKGWFLYAVETNPGATGPTDQYDMVINDVHGLDIMGGALANRSNTSTECVFPKFIQTSAAFVPMDGTSLTLVVTNNAVANSTVTIKFYLSK